ncbi:hypothetical protein [Clostridium sp.]|uniref:hypothetical protein n=1 Tax=Clostridium sp. TaxID=1506 RepID=UPI003463C7CC
MEKNITKAELIEKVNKLDNPMDRFIVVGIFYGLAGESTEGAQILEVKKSDVNLEENTIKLEDGSVVVMDSLLRKVTVDAMNQEVYVKMGTVGAHTNEDYNLNPNCPYIIKGKPSKLNDMGMKRLGGQSLKTRLTAISKYLGVSCSRRLLKQSGIFHMLKEEKANWTIREAEDFLKKNGLSLRRNNLMEVLKEINVGNC